MLGDLLKKGAKKKLVDWVQKNSAEADLGIRNRFVIYLVDF